MASEYLSTFSGLKKPYQAALNGDWEAMKSFYDKHPEHVVRPLTIDGLTALHIAGYNSEGTELLQHLLGLLPPSEISLAISKKSDHHNNVFHEVASTNNVASAELLITKLSGKNLPELNKILEDRNQLGETPLFRAAALGQTKMAKFLAELVNGDIGPHFHRHDSMSILHAAVLGQHFETAIWLLGKDNTLGTRKEINGMTCLHLLAKMPSAFRSSCNMGKVKRLLYYCLPAHLDDDVDDSNEVQKTSSQMEDLEIGSQDTSSLRQSNKHPPAISRIYYAMWRGLAKEWPAIDEIWKAKRKYESALELTNLLAKMDTTWANSLKVKDRPISLGKGSDSLDEESNSTEGGADKGGGGGDQTLDTPLLIAASEGIVEIFDEILDAHPQAIEHISKDEVTIVVAAICHRQREIFRRLKMMKGVMEHRLFSLIDKRGYTILHHAADMKNYNGGTRWSCTPIAGGVAMVREWLSIDKIWKMKKTHTSALNLTKMLMKMDTTWTDNFKAQEKTIFLGRADSLASNDVVGAVELGKGGKGSGKEEQSSSTTGEGKGGGVTDQEEGCERNREPYTPLLIAASEGIEEIFDEILEVHPQAIEHISKDEENILHVAIGHRQMEIFRRVKKMKIIMDRWLVSRIDKRGYTILHHVAKMKDYDGGTKAGPALQLQEELKWLKRVQKIIPSDYVIHRNNDNKTADNKTADELFKANHVDLLKKAQRWTKETSQSCSAVAVLVATVVFAAAYTVPGGNNEKGQPIFLNSPFFLFFTVMDVVSLASSLTSVVTFLSSPFELEDFHRSLPSKLMIGFSLLFFSVTATMLSFTATILLIIRLEKRRWTLSLIYTAAFLPVAVFALMQFPLYIAFTRGVHSFLKKTLKRVPILKLIPRFFKA